MPVSLSSALYNADPNATSQKAAQPIVNLTYPIGENLTNRCAIRFVEYERWTPQSKGQDKTTAIINLPLPAAIPDNTQLKMGGTDTDFLFNNYGKISDAISGHRVQDIINGMSSGYNDISKKSLIRAFALAGETLSRATGIPLADSAIDSASLTGGVVKNPHTTTIFDGVATRSFNFTWKFSARNKAESDMINNIIQTIRTRILPEESFKGYALDFPDLAYIEFLGDINGYFPKIYRSFINYMSVNTSTGDSIVIFKSGAPVIVELTLTFGETNIQTRRTLRDGTI
jgi:hypothetical protein